MKLLFISCLLIAGTFADYFVDKVGSCVKVRDGGRNNIVLDLEYMNDMSEEQKKNFARKDLVSRIARKDCVIQTQDAMVSNFY